MKALVLAGGFPQIALIQELKIRGIEVVLADYNVAPVAKSYADKFYSESTLDLLKIQEIAELENIDFLITACTDQALLTVAKVSEELNLPCYIDYQTALDVTNKKYMKEVFVQQGISTPRYVTLEELDENKISGLHFPCIVKPVDCNSSKGVRKCETIAQLRLFFSEAINMSRTKTAIVEEFITGTEISVDVYVENGRVHILSTLKLEKIPDKDKFIIFRGICPAKEAVAVSEKIQKTAQQIADAFHIVNSPMLIQMVTNGKDVYVLEFSARTGGGTKYITIKQASGFDVIKAVVDLTLGTKPHVGEIIAEAAYIVTEHVYCSPGVFDHLEGFEELKQEGIISDYYLYQEKGTLFDSVNASGDRVAGYTILSETEEELNEKHNVINSRIKVISTEGYDMMRHDLISDL